MNMKLSASSWRPFLPPLTVLVAALAVASAYASPSVEVQEGSEDNTVEGVTRYFDAFLIAVMAWNVMVVTLEVNDFRQRLIVAFEASSASSRQLTHRCVASLVAVRYGLRDALIDWSIMYSASYGIVAGITYTDADPDSLQVFLGFGLIYSAALMALCGLKFPQWAGIHRIPHYQAIKDTSNLAKQAVHELNCEGSSLTDFRYKVRLGVGKHFAKFIYVLLPFHVGLRVWSYLCSILLGVLFGHVVLFLVFEFRKRFDRHRVAVGIGTSVFLFIVSALIFARGIYVVDEGWKRFSGNEHWIIPLSLCGWLGVCLIVLGVRHYGQRRVSREEEEGGEEEEERPSLFGYERSTMDNAVAEDESEEDDAALTQPLLDGSSSADRRAVMEKSSPESHRQSYFYESAYFDRVKLRGGTITESLRSDLESENDGIDETATPQHVYKQFASIEKSGVKWYQSLWQFLPFQPAWRLSVIETSFTFGCCVKDSTYKKLPSLPVKFFFVIIQILKVFINLLSIYVTVVACGATIQRKATVTKLPYPEKVLYGPKMNKGPVCAFDEKCGDIRTFPAKEDAHASNFTIAHCGPCGSCSNWNDFRLQPTDLATPARTCGQMHLLDGISETQACIQRDIGFTEECALHWAKNVVCSRQHCAFIYIQSLMTNQVGNFEVGPHTITSATCSEASCEAGNPGNFVAKVGANRRRMNIRSEIARPLNQQCQIVDIEKDSKKFSDWTAFMDPECEHST